MAAIAWANKRGEGGIAKAGEGTDTPLSSHDVQCTTTPPQSTCLGDGTTLLHLIIVIAVVLACGGVGEGSSDASCSFSWRGGGGWRGGVVGFLAAGKHRCRSSPSRLDRPDVSSHGHQHTTITRASAESSPCQRRRLEYLL